MAQRYFVAVPIPPSIVEKLNALCIRLTGHASPVRFHHISLIPPFTLRVGVTEQQCIDAMRGIVIQPVAASLRNLGTFHQLDRVILVGHVEPNAVLATYANQIQNALQPFVQIDATPYTNGIVPTFEAHTTIDYNATLLIPESEISQIDVNEIDWPIILFGMYKEIEKGVWEAV